MNRATESTEPAVHLSVAKKLIEAGDQERALDELWRVEALARGNANTCREILDFLASYGLGDAIGPSADWRQPLSWQSAALADLVAALRRDIGVETGEPPQAVKPSRSALGRGVRVFCWIVLVSVLLVAVLLVGFGVALIGPSGGLDFTDVGKRLIVVGGVVAIVAIASMVALARSGRPR